METETIGEFVASDGKNYLFYTDRVRKPKEVKRVPLREGRKFNGRICSKCGGTERYALNGQCVACNREKARLKNAQRKAKHD
ncbi:hypothetical protein K5H98_004315 [Salmonella enterica]|nr:hypothetical protein [Salmonella enterica]